MLRFDGELIHLAALANASPEGGDALRRAFPTPPRRHTAASRAILTGATVDIPDVQNDPDYELTGEARTAGYRSIVAVPMLRDGRSIGTLNVHGAEIGQFSERQIQLLRTFADQAVIAIENVRLFTELEARNRDLTESLEQQTATSEILEVISSSPTDVQPVFDRIVRSALRLCDGLFLAVTGFGSCSRERTSADCVERIDGFALLDTRRPPRAARADGDRPDFATGMERQGYRSI